MRNNYNYRIHYLEKLYFLDKMYKKYKKYNKKKYIPFRYNLNNFSKTLFFISKFKNIYTNDTWYHYYYKHYINNKKVLFYPDPHYQEGYFHRMSFPSKRRLLIDICLIDDLYSFNKKQIFLNLNNIYKKYINYFFILPSNYFFYFNAYKH